MRIAFISTLAASPWGGSEELWRLVAKRAVEEKHDVLASISKFKTDAEKVRQLEAKGTVIHRRKRFVASGSLPNRIIMMLKKKLASKTGYNFSGIKKYDPEAICVNLSTTYDLLNEPELRNFLSGVKAPFGFICQGHSDVPFISDEYRLIVRDMFLKANWIAFVSQSNLESCQRHLAVKLPQGFVVNNPANLNNLEYLPYPQPSEPLKFACVARLHAVQKGQDILFEVLSGQQWLNRDWICTMVGEGDAQKEYFTDLVRLYGIQDKVRFAGQVSDIQSVWRDQHLLVLPSRYEGTPLALIEAMICGRTAVVTDAGGNAEWINEENGFLAEAANSRYFASAMERMWSNRHQLENFGKKCRESATHQFDINIDQKILNVIIKGK
jgi:L-malate glycosyltransferase